VEDCVNRFKVSGPLVNPVVSKAPDDCTDVPDEVPNSIPPVLLQFNVMLFAKVLVLL
jgi:hypothetical protein